MLDQDDQFYKQLPFTLTAEQSKPNFVIFGTGLQQCLLAAHYSKIHMKPGLILDIDKTYGSCLKTVTIKELHALTIKKTTVNLYQFIDLPQFEELNLKYYNKIIEQKAHRGYNIDLQPNFFFGSSISCQMLKDADMDKYMDFRIVYNMLHFDGKGLKNVPLSKGKIFQSKDLGLLEKKLLLSTFHSLSQIYNKHMKVEFDQNSTKQFDKQFGQVDQKLYSQFVQNRSKFFVPFLSKVTKNNNKIMNYIIYILCNYQYNYKKQLPPHARNDYTLEEFIKRFGKFVKSCGIYGQGPYLYVDNGIGDVPQAYSRIASIYASTYILHPKIQINKIEVSAQNHVRISTNLYPQGLIQTSHVYYGPTCYNLKYNDKAEYEQQYTLRVIILCEKLGKQQDCPSIVYLLDVKQCQNPVYLFMLDNTSHSCPDNLILYQFQTVIQSRQNEKCSAKIQSFIEILKLTRGDVFNQSIRYISAYIREKRYPKQIENKTENQQTILRDHTGIDLDSHFLNFKAIVGDQQHYFKKQGANQGTDGEGQWNPHEDQTTGLISRLQALDINKQQVQKQQQHEQQADIQQTPAQEQPRQHTPYQKQQKQLQNKQKQNQQNQEIKLITQDSKYFDNNEAQKQKQIKNQNQNDQSKNKQVNDTVVLKNQDQEGYITHIQ